MNHKIIGMAIGVLLGFAAGVWAAQAPTNTAEFGGTLSPFKKAPVIDGKVDSGEWDGAIRTVGFQDIQTDPQELEIRGGTTYCGFTADRLYLLIVSELSPIGIMANGKNRDAELVWDDGIEIWFDPNRDRRVSGEGDQSFYQAIVNPRGAIEDKQFDPKKGAPDNGWNADWEFANGINMSNHTWTAELSIPFKDLGWAPGTAINRSIGLLIARNYKAPWQQVTWFPHRGAFVSWFLYPRLRLTADAPSVALEQLGPDFLKGKVDLKARVFNPGPARQAKVNLHIQSSDMPDLKDEKVLDLPANGAVEYAWKNGEGTLHTDAHHKMFLTVGPTDFGTTYFNDRINWTEMPSMLIGWDQVKRQQSQRWWVGNEPNPAAAVQVAYYPSYQFVRVRLEPSQLSADKGTNIFAAAVSLTSTNGKVVMKEKMTWTNAPASREFKVGDLPDGDYTLAVDFNGWTNTINRTVKRKHFPFEGNKLGITDQVFPPFEPIKVKKDVVAVVGREYTVDGLGLWKSVKSLDREILAGPIVLKAGSQNPESGVRNDEQILTGKGKFKSKKDNSVVYEGVSKNPAVTVKSRCTTEEDGCMKVELTLEPGTKDQELKSLTLEIPLVDKLMPLWHAATTQPRVNPAGAIPSGEGDFWDSRKFPDGQWFGNFKCYLWVGADERGLCWFADNDKGWVLATDAKGQASAPCQVLNRKDGVLTLKVNLVQAPIKIKEPRTITFGLMASPGKPMRKDWRNITHAVDIKGYKKFLWMGCEYWGADEVFCSKYPRNGDLSVIEAMGNARRGKPCPEFAGWGERNSKPGMYKPVKDLGSVIGLANHSIGVARGAGTNDIYAVYWDEFHTTSLLHPETQIFQNEWSGTYGYGTIGGLVSSYRDFAVYWAAEFVKRGVGLYFDNSFPKRAYDPLTTSAYVLPNGEIQPSASLWAHREYLKRIWVLHRQLGPKDAEPGMIIHDTNTHIIPYMTFCDALLDLEWFYGAEPHQARYSADFLRAESTARQSGNLPFVLARNDSWKSEAQHQIAKRTRFGAFMVHEIKPEQGDDNDLFMRVYNFGYGLEGCQVWNYWQEDYPVKVSAPQAKSILMKKGNELMLVVCTWDQNPSTVTFTFDPKTVGPLPASAANYESGAALPWDAQNGKISLDLDGYGVRIVRIK